MSDRRASVTAAVVASTLLLLRDDPELGALAPPEARDSIEAAVRETVPLFGHALDRIPWPVLKRAAYAVERLVSPGFVAHYALRKHAVREHLRRAVDRGATQVVLVGAGFDLLAAAVPEGATIFEVDHPATQRARREVASRAVERAVTFVPADLSCTRLRAALLDVPSFDPTADTVYVAEGLLMYLERARVEDVLADMASGDAAATIIVTIITPDRLGRLRLHSQRRIVDWCMRWLDEPFVWGLRREDVASTLKGHGFDVERMDSTIDIRDRVLESHARRRMPRESGEVLVVATKPRRKS